MELRMADRVGKRMNGKNLLLPIQKIKCDSIVEFWFQERKGLKGLSASELDLMLLDFLMGGAFLLCL